MHSIAHHRLRSVHRNSVRDWRHGGTHGLAAFITATINEVDIEDAFGLDPMEKGVISARGFGHRGSERNAIEFDPLNAAWSE